VHPAAARYCRANPPVIESSDNAIISIDLNGVIVSWNQGAERLFGYSAGEAVGKPIMILIPSDRQDEEPNILDRIRRGERVDHYKTLRRRRDESLVNISLSVSPVRDGWRHSRWCIQDRARHQPAQTSRGDAAAAAGRAKSPR
jgi:PAS domain S-box-containing protein